MRSTKTFPDRRIQTRRAPAVLLGLSLAAMAACSAAFAENSRPAAAPVVCEIALEPAGSDTLITGRVHASRATQGAYAMAITSTGGGGRTTIRQSGDFSVAAGGTEVLGETRLSGSPRSHHVDLDVTVGGRALTCTDAHL